MENQEMCSKEDFFSYFDEEGEIFEQIVEEINFENFQNVKTLLLNCISNNEEVLIDFYSNGFLDDLNKFNKETNEILFEVSKSDDITTFTDEKLGQGVNVQLLFSYLLYLLSFIIKEFNPPEIIFTSKLHTKKIYNLLITYKNI